MSEGFLVFAENQKCPPRLLGGVCVINILHGNKLPLTYGLLQTLGTGDKGFCLIWWNTQTGPCPSTSHCMYSIKMCCTLVLMHWEFLNFRGLLHLWGGLDQRKELLTREPVMTPKFPLTLGSV